MNYSNCLITIGAIWVCVCFSNTRIVPDVFRSHCITIGDMDVGLLGGMDAKKNLN